MTAAVFKPRRQRAGALRGAGAFNRGIRTTRERLGARCPSTAFFGGCLIAFATLLGLSIPVYAQDIQPTNTLHFRAVDIFVDGTNQPLAAYQLEFTASAGVQIVGIEGGKPAAFREAPFYDPKAIQHERVIIGAFSTAAADQLPTGRTRVATIHLLTTGELPPRFEVQLKAAATVGGKKISVYASAQEQRNENDTAAGEE